MLFKCTPVPDLLNIDPSAQIVGVLGYLSFGSKVGANIITMYPSTSLFVCFGRVSIVILTLCSYPLQVHPCRAALDKVFSRTQHDRPSLPILGNGDAGYSDGQDDEVDQGNGSAHQALLTPVAEPAATVGQGEMSLQRLCVLTGIILTSTFVIALCVDDLGLVLGYVGSVGSTTISFIVSTLKLDILSLSTCPKPDAYL